MKDINKNDDNWKEELDRLREEGQKSFRIWLKKNHMKRPKTEEEMYELVDKISGRMPH